MLRLSVFRLLLLLGLLLPASVAAQTFMPLYEGQTGTALLASLRSAFAPGTTYSYARARDTLFAFVDDGDRSLVTDVYAGRTLALPKGADPTIAACNGDGDNNASSCNGTLNFNTEHAYPQSKGAASGAAQADLHHLYPSRADVNSARGNLPFGAFAPSVTSKYFRDLATVTCSTGGCPPANADAYSAVSVPIGTPQTAYFMPRASVRGDLARSVFYFYTIYRAQADAADPAFFASMLPALLRWHHEDPVSAAEQARSARVKRYQGNDNPFVLDTTLARRAYDPAYTPPALPVELVAFSAVADGRTVRLAWTTASETNSAGFVVERRSGDAWTDASALIAGRGTTTEQTDYAFAVDGLAAGAHTFRLRQVDADGAAHWSAPRTVEVVAAADGAVRVTPVPARTAATVVPVLPRHATGRVEVVDALGRVVFSAEAAPDVPLRVDVSGWPAGRYAVRLWVEGRAATTPLVVR